jgi:hypothetical protein
VDLDEFFRGRPEARAIFDVLFEAAAVLDGVGIRPGKSQVGFYRGHPFAAAWIPGRYLAGRRPPLVLSLFLRRRHPSPRWKEVVEPQVGRFTHHLELGAPEEVDDEVRGWLAEAWRDA